MGKSMICLHSADILPSSKCTNTGCQYRRRINFAELLELETVELANSPIHLIEPLMRLNKLNNFCMWIDQCSPY